MLENEVIHLSQEKETEILKDMKYSWEQLDQDLEQLKDWLRKQYHLPPSRLKEKDNFLKMYLTGCKGSLETVKRKLDAYYSHRGKSEIYRSRDVLQKEYRASCDYCYNVILPKPTKNYEWILIQKFKDSGTENFDHLNIHKSLINIIDMACRFKEINPPVCAIFDFGNLTPGHVLLVSPSYTRDLLHLVQNVFPARIKKMIFFNVPTFMEIVINNFIKPFLSKKIKERMMVTSGGCEELHKIFDKDDLPKDFGGNMRYIKEYNELWNEYEIANSEMFINELSEETDESKRLDKSNDFLINDNLFGVQGTLKKLVID